MKLHGRELKISIFNLRDLINIVISGITIASLSLIMYRLGLRTGNLSTATTMAFYTLLYANWFIGIINWIEKYNKIKYYFLSFIFISLSFIIQNSIIYLPVLCKLFNIVQLSQKNWNQIAVACLLIVSYLTLLKFIEIVRRNNNKHKNIA